MNAIEKWKGYCGGSGALAWLTLTEAGVWLIVTIVALAGKLLHFDDFIADWLTLPSEIRTFLTRPWTLASYMAVHFDVLHMLFNVAWLYWFGRILLITLSERHLLYYFIGGGVAGGLFFLAASAMGMESGWLCGASAAVISVMCGAAVRMPDHRVNLLLIGSVKLKWVAAACCLLTFLGGGGNQAAHIGGLLWGAATAFSIRRGFDPAARLSAIRKSGVDNSSAGGRKRDPRKMVDALRQHREDVARLDELLDKIRISGYESLSSKERKELNELSKRISD